ncbi:MAG TPA: fumarylacetoacetate hydrolase family protein [Terracidiphilus sp.]|nr:fumarylacetoacetate hydrolase family protein [Terracidiphilus sp.]
MKLYRTTGGAFVEHEDAFYRVPDASWDVLVCRDALYGYLLSVVRGGARADFDSAAILGPIGSQEVWAAGVTYYRSRNARMEEAKSAGGGDFYDRVYLAERPELFFKAAAGRVVGPGGKVRIRGDAAWSVPEPELTLLVNSRGQIAGYTIGNDMSSRDIEGENPLYLPQAKVYDGSCALGPCILVAEGPLPASTEIRIEIARGGRMEFTGATTLAELKREPAVLAEYLFRETSFPAGVFLMTGTGIVPPDSFALAHGDRVRIMIDAIGMLENEVVRGRSK